MAMVVCYLIGSIPTAYIFVRLKLKRDITEEGSGNVGALNAGKVTDSKLTGAVVLVIDLLKGLIPVYLMLYVFAMNFNVVMAGASFLILGHNYPVWLGFKGGRGLATGTGIFLTINYFVFVGWCFSWIICFFIKKNVLVANAVSTATIPVYVYLIGLLGLHQASKSVQTFSFLYFSIFTIIIILLILSRHLVVLKNLFINKITVRT